MRAIWIATVKNIDWPSTDSVPAEQQRAEMIDILDRAAAAGFNTVVFQVRPAATALYRSQLEPWARELTGRQGTDPGYDPLEFTVAEAHARGLEVHVWLNPFRAGTDADTVLAPNHLRNTRPELVKQYGAQLWLDPGEPEAREHTARVIQDIVKRYEVDGIHVDDYFYPYQVRDTVTRQNVDFPDSGSYARSGSTLSRNDWRRENIDKFVERMYTDAHAIRPTIKVGISPFGIWRPGYPEGVCCFDAYESIYADSRKWLREGWVDYFTPQLYWAISAPQQPFGKILDWWIAENVKERHIWPGLADYRVSNRPNSLSPSEMPDQIRLTRSRPGAPGQVYFNTTSTLKRNLAVLDSIKLLYAQRALVPAFPWLDNTPPPAPTLTVTGKTVQVASTETPRFWLVQAQSRGGWFRKARWTSRVVGGDSKSIALDFEPQRVRVNAIDPAGNMGPTADYTRAP